MLIIYVVLLFISPTTLNVIYSFFSQIMISKLIVAVLCETFRYPLKPSSSGTLGSIFDSLLKT